MIARSVIKIGGFSCNGFIKEYSYVRPAAIQVGEVRAHRGSIIMILAICQKCVSNPNLHNSNVRGQGRLVFLLGSSFPGRAVWKLAIEAGSISVVGAAGYASQSRDTGECMQTGMRKIYVSANGEGWKSLRSKKVRLKERMPY